MLTFDSLRSYRALWSITMAARVFVLALSQEICYPETLFSIWAHLYRDFWARTRLLSPIYASDRANVVLGLLVLGPATWHSLTVPVLQAQITRCTRSPLQYIHVGSTRIRPFSNTFMSHVGLWDSTVSKGRQRVPPKNIEPLSLLWEGPLCSCLIPVWHSKSH